MNRFPFRFPNLWLAFLGAGIVFMVGYAVVEKWI